MNDNYEEQLYLYGLCQLGAAGVAVIDRLFERFGSLSKVYRLSEKELYQKKVFSDKVIIQFLRMRREFEKTRAEYHSLEDRGIKFITLLDESFPERLRNLPGRPAALYVKGRLPEDQVPAVAIVGARDCSSYGRQAAEWMAGELAGNGVRIISGLAYGIDIAGHRGALKADGRTFAVLGSGVNVCYPREHFDSYQEIALRGGIISEFPLGSAPKPYHFPMRNRIISGLADAVIIIEAKEKSGSLITVDFALEQGKEIFALPGRVTDEWSKGCHQLIQHGAALLISPAEVLEYLGINSSKKLSIHEKSLNRLAKKEKMVYSCLDLKEKCLEQIIEETGLSVSECMNILLNLELEGYLYRTAGFYYIKKL